MREQVHTIYLPLCVCTGGVGGVEEGGSGLGGEGRGGERNIDSSELEKLFRKWRKGGTIGAR